MIGEKSFRFLISLLCEFAVFFAWHLVVIIPIKVVYNALNDNIALYLSGIALVFAFLRGYRSYRNLKTTPTLWHKEPFVFLALGDICLSVFLLLIHLSQFSNTPDNGSLFLGFFFSFSWILLMLIAVFIVRKNIRN